MMLLHYYDVSLHYFNSLVCLHIRFPSGSMLVHNKFTNAHDLALMNVVAHGGVGVNRLQPCLLFILSLTLEPVIPWGHVSP